MALDAQLVSMMHEEVILTPVTGKDRFNNFLYGTPVPVRCYIDRENKRALDIQGRETTSTVQVILADPSLEVTVDSKIVLPDGSAPAIIEVLGAKDEFGEPYYLEVRA